MIEQLADKEHASWARWMKYLFSKCDETYDGNYVIPCEFVERWRRQVNTSYTELSEQEKQSDRDEVAHILPIIQEYTQAVQQLARDQHAYLLEIAPHSYQEGKRASHLREQWQALGLGKEMA